MKIKIAKVLGIISLIILGLSILGAISVSTGLLDSVFNSGNLIVDGADFSGLFKIFGSGISFILGILVVVYGIGFILTIWFLYALILLITLIIKKIKNSNI